MYSLVQWILICQCSSLYQNQPLSSTKMKYKTKWFWCMTARKGDIKPQYYKEKGHTWVYKTTWDRTRPYKAKYGSSIPYQCHRRLHFAPIVSLWSLSLLKGTFFCSLCTFFVHMHIFCSLAHFLFPCTLFVEFGTFFTHVLRQQQQK